MSTENSTTMEYDPFRDYLGLRNLLLPPPKPCRPVTGQRQWSTGSRDHFCRETASENPNDDLRELDELQVCGREETQTFIQENHVDCFRTALPITEDEMQELLTMVQNFFLERLGGLPRSRSLSPVGSMRQTMYCAFCRQNGEMRNYYLSHDLKDRFGRVICPVLRSYVCPQCRATGDDAHTLKYCPLAKREESVPLAKALRAGRNCSGQRRDRRNSELDN